MDAGTAQTPDLRQGSVADTEACVAIWVAACTARDGQAFDGVADRARPKFGRAIAWRVADGSAGSAGSPGSAGSAGVTGFALATAPGSGMDTDPPEAAVVGLLAVDPGAQAHGVGRALLRAVTDDLTDLGHRQAVLHALIDNTRAMRLYASEGWEPIGAVYEHSLLHRPMRTLGRDLSARPAAQ